MEFHDFSRFSMTGYTLKYIKSDTAATGHVAVIQSSPAKFIASEVCETYRILSITDKSEHLPAMDCRPLSVMSGQEARLRCWRDVWYLMPASSSLVT